MSDAPKPSEEAIQAARNAFREGHPHFAPVDWISEKRLTDALTAAYATDADLIALTREEREALAKAITWHRADDPLVGAYAKLHSSLNRESD